MPKKESGYDKKSYDKGYQHDNIRFRKMNFNERKPEDKQMMDWIDAQPEGTSNYLKRLVNDDMQARAN